MPDHEALYYDVTNAKPFRRCPVPVGGVGIPPRKKRETPLREFLLTIFILVTCIASLGICIHLYLDTDVRIKDLVKEVRDLKQELKVIKRQQHEDKLAIHQLETKKFSCDSCIREHDPDIPESGVVEDSAHDDPNDSANDSNDSNEDGNNDPDYIQYEDVEGSTQQDRGVQEQRRPNTQPPLGWSPSDSQEQDLSNERRRRRSAQSTNSKTGKRSVPGIKVESECENTDCNEAEMATKHKLAKEQEIDDGKLTAGNSRDEDMSLPDTQEEENFTQQSVKQSTSARRKAVKTREGKAKPRIYPAVIKDEEPEEVTMEVDKLVLAAHFGGQTNKYSQVPLRHPYSGNGHLVHPGGVFKDWESSPWVRRESMDKYFHLKNNGTLTVTVPGLYFVYAQIYYSNTHSLSSYRVYRNDEAVFQCTTEMHNKTYDTRISCFTGGLVYFDANDRLTLKEVEGERRTNFEKTRSFFGLFKIN